MEVWIPRSDFDALMESKTDQLDSAKQALLDKAGETGARGEALATSEAEKSDLEGQNENDEGFLADTKVRCCLDLPSWIVHWTFLDCCNAVCPPVA